MLKKKEVKEKTIDEEAYDESIKVTNLLSKKVKADLDGLMIQSKTPLFQMKDSYQSMLPLAKNTLKIKRNEVKIFPFESSQSGVMYEEKFPGRYFKEFGMSPGALPKHRLRGTSFPGINFPHIRTSVLENLVDGVFLVSDEEVDTNYEEYVKSNPHLVSDPEEAISKMKKLPHWDDPRFKGNEFGRSTRAGIAMASRLRPWAGESNILIIAYDKANRYDF